MKEITEADAQTLIRLGITVQAKYFYEPVQAKKSNGRHYIGSTQNRLVVVTKKNVPDTAHEHAAIWCVYRAFDSAEAEKRHTVVARARRLNKSLSKTQIGNAISHLLAGGWVRYVT